MPVSIANYLDYTPEDMRRSLARAAQESFTHAARTLDHVGRRPSEVAGDVAAEFLAFLHTHVAIERDTFCSPSTTSQSVANDVKVHLERLLAKFQDAVATTVSVVSFGEADWVKGYHLIIRYDLTAIMPEDNL